MKKERDVKSKTFLSGCFYCKAVVIVAEKVRTLVTIMYAVFAHGYW